ncbi:MAG: EAL domain-containing protein [Rhizobiales bacterium]|jgi:EAL domain-containing protein (putative c-di-GMP-specific phosphodiesterase class I)/FixJ family two-component response regulator|nr:EAL domain-containing protein [Hyphomicrobiales bacterium]
MNLKTFTLREDGLQGDAPSVVPSSVPPGERLCCFIVDDEPAIQSLLSNALVQFDFHVESFNSAQTALTALKRTRPHLVFLDVSLEGSDAVDVIRGLEEARFAGKVQLVSGTHQKTLDDLRLIGERHALSMLPPLQKPFRIQQVRQIVSENLAELLSAPQALPAKPVNSSYQKLRLSEVLDNNWFQLWYQPKIDIQKMKPVGAEGLARCVHPVFGTLLPSSFLPGADEASLAKLGERALIQSLYDWPLFGRLGIPFKLAINLSIESLSRIPITKIIRELRPKESEWPGMIIEITENQAIKDIHAIHEIATQLKLYGISIAIDDFGAGYSHLARLKDLPFEELKIDGSLISNCDRDEQTATLCRTAIELAHKFDTVAVAECVERPSEVRVLQQMGCDIAQGHLFANATPRDTLIASMKKRMEQARATT